MEALRAPDGQHRCHRRPQGGRSPDGGFRLSRTGRSSGSALSRIARPDRLAWLELRLGPIALPQLAQGACAPTRATNEQEK
ncbi:hypothetical protein CHELA1G11_40160 [Hyphomicrobiales bacterium]|nr:hypothetical protein CHELA1G2_40151 [Hyphomicrobiales bacterium]CAH1696649.1 hypothetical protein CHELA1G11_40160 [Hyphomicrobiales bacterium]